tara:strand:- start:22 stop:945 length:924 start_codon:yes stop_codon:yes gene_type:complete
MNQSAWIFPGQGSQNVGMGHDIFHKTDIGKKYFEEAQKIMNYDIKSIIFNGPEDKLRKTEFTQPAIYIVSVALGKLLISRDISPVAVAGHSLGEYSALTIAGGINFLDGLKLVKLRSESMAKSGKIRKGTMAAIIGLDDDIIELICRSYRGSGCVNPANYNSPKQVVISGSSDAVFWAMREAKESGARMVKELNVSGAFHSSLMKPTTEELAEAINSLEISDLKYPLFTNVDAKPKIKGIDIKKTLIDQVENPVLWSQSISSIKQNGINNFLEIGPGRVLCGLNKRIDKSIKCLSIDSLSKLEKVFV